MIVKYQKKELNGKILQYAIFGGYTFCKDEKTGYYLNSTIHERLHRYVYETIVGPIPNGFIIHHIDHNKDNNEIENLSILSGKEHRIIHSIEMTQEERERKRENMKLNAIPAAKEWHTSKDGIEWHKNHYEKMKTKFHCSVNKICELCGKNYSTTNTNSKFCSNNCKSKYRRKHGLDDVEIQCAICGKKFKRNKYKLNKTGEYACSKECNAWLVAKHKRENRV